MIVSGIRELVFRFCSNRYVYRIPIRGDKIGDIISIRRSSDWLEIVIGGERNTTLLK